MMAPSSMSIGTAASRAMRLMQPTPTIWPSGTILLALTATISVRPEFETGDPRYAWLSNIVSFTQSRTGDGGVIHRFYAVR